MFYVLCCPFKVFVCCLKVCCVCNPRCNPLICLSTANFVKEDAFFVPELNSNLEWINARQISVGSIYHLDTQSSGATHSREFSSKLRWTRWDMTVPLGRSLSVGNKSRIFDFNYYPSINIKMDVSPDYIVGTSSCIWAGWQAGISRVARSCEFCELKKYKNILRWWKLLYK